MNYSDKYFLEFFEEKLPDSQGRYINDVINFNDTEIEDIHDFIQWLFPLDCPSAVNFNCPIVTKNIRLLIANSDLASKNYCRSCKRFLNFIGYDCYCEKKPFNVKSRLMSLPFHNYLRITRLLKSLTLFGFENCSRKIFCLLMIDVESKNNIVPNSTIDFWYDTQK